MQYPEHLCEYKPPSFYASKFHDSKYLIVAINLANYSPAEI